jgi:uncharacterized protein
LIQRAHGEAVVPTRLRLTADTLALAAELIAVFRRVQGRTRGALEAERRVLEGDHTDYRVKRGLAHLLASAFSTFEGCAPLEPAALRQRVFALSAQTIPSPQPRLATLTAVADALSRELSRDISPAQVRAWLYADLPAAHVLTRFEAPTPEVLRERYNLAQAQGVLYRASQVVITAHRNDPGEYKLLFRYLKLFGLMAYIEGDAEHGFTLTIDGPASLFTPSPRYGLALAKLLPALLHVTRWHLTATLVPREGWAKNADSLATGARGGPNPVARQCHGARFSAGASGRPQRLARTRRLLASGVSPEKVCPGAPGGAGGCHPGRL